MTNPVLLAVDDDPAVLATVARDLRKRYGRDDRILRVDSGAAAIELLVEKRSEHVALLLSEQRMPQMDGMGRPYLLETNVLGIFASGDARHDSVKRVASAVGEGSVAVYFMH